MEKNHILEVNKAVCSKGTGFLWKRNIRGFNVEICRGAGSKKGEGKKSVVGGEKGEAFWEGTQKEAVEQKTERTTSSKLCAGKPGKG